MSTHLTSDQRQHLSAWAGEWLDELPEDPLHDLRYAAAERARIEAQAGLPRPTSAWAREYGLPLGLSRLTEKDPMRLADGTILAEHQDEVVEGVLAFCLDEELRRASATLADPGVVRRAYVEHATGSGKTVVACALVDAQRSGGVLILTDRLALEKQFARELTSRGYGTRLVDLDHLDRPSSHPAPVVITTYQTFARRWAMMDLDRFALVICDEAHKSLGDQTTNGIRALEEHTVIGMTATGKLLAKEVADLYPVCVSRLNLTRATEVGVLAPLRCLRVPPAIGIETMHGLRRPGGDFDEDKVRSALDVPTINYAAATFYRDTFGDLPGVVYAAGIEHAEHVAGAFVRAGVAAVAVSGDMPPREVEQILADFEARRLQVIVNAQLLTEGWNSPGLTVCMHLAPTSSERVYVQRTGRVTRRTPGKEAGIVVDFVPAAYADEQIMTLHRVLNADTYQTGQLVTRSPHVHEPAEVQWPEVVLTPTVSEPALRREWLRENFDAVTVDELPFVDRMVWAEETGIEVRSPSEFDAFFRQAQGLEAEIAATMAGAAFMSNRVKAVRERAYERLLERPSQENLDLLMAVAQDSEDAILVRKMMADLLQIASMGSEMTLPMVFEIAQLDRTVLISAAAREHAWRGHAHRDGSLRDRDPMTRKRLLNAAEKADDSVAAAIFALMPSRDRYAPDADVEEVILRRFQGPMGFARGLLLATGRLPVGHPGVDERWKKEREEREHAMVAFQKDRPDSANRH